MPTPTQDLSASGVDPLRLYTYEEIAVVMAIEPRQVRRMVEEGRLGYVKTGPHRGRRVSGQNYLDYVARNTVEPAAA
jgi:excisionase family DNA binding protein